MWPQAAYYKLAGHTPPAFCWLETCCLQYFFFTVFLSCDSKCLTISDSVSSHCHGLQSCLRNGPQYCLQVSRPVVMKIHRVKGEGETKLPQKYVFKFLIISPLVIKFCSLTPNIKTAFCSYRTSPSKPNNNISQNFHFHHEVAYVNFSYTILNSCLHSISA